MHRQHQDGAYHISIHALREEGDIMPPLVPMGVSPFLSTPSVRRATIIGQVLTGTTSHFYPRPPRGGRRFIFHSEVCIWKFLSTPSARRATGAQGVVGIGFGISIHALREEGDFGAGP